MSANTSISGMPAVPALPRPVPSPAQAPKTWTLLGKVHQFVTKKIFTVQAGHICRPADPARSLAGRVAISKLPTLPEEDAGLHSFAVAEESIEGERRILTGRVTEISLPDTASLTLRRNLAYAKAIIRHVQGVILFSDNFMDRSLTVRNDPDRFSKEKREMMGKFLYRQMRPSSTNRWENAKLAEKFGIGNCGEMADIGYKYAEGVVQVRTARIRGGDHAFIVVGKQPDAVICDPWSGAYYPLSEAETYLRNYKGVADMDTASLEYREGHTLIELFDPSRHSIVNTTAYL